MKLERVAIVAHPAKTDAGTIARDLARFLDARGIGVADHDPDLVVALGGDGTVLRASHLAHACDAPLIGVNLGALGYLTETDGAEARGALERILRGDFEIEERMMLQCWVAEASFVGLNEVLVERSAGHRLVRLSVGVGGETLADFNADGVIVATPTGSTAYALSAGGPIVSPQARCLVLVPVSAHMIFARPFVLPDYESVEITVAEDKQASLSLDGAAGRELDGGETVTVRRHDRPLRLVRLSGPDFLQRLRVKLGLPG